MTKPRLDPQLYTETYHLFGAMERVAINLGYDSASARETVRMLPQNLKEAVAFRDAITGLWRYDFGDPYTTQDEKHFVFGTDQCPQVKWLYQCVQLMQGVLSDSQLLLFLERLGDTSKHLEALVECSPLLVLRGRTKARYEAPGSGEKRVDFLLTPESGPPVLIDAKCRIRELIRKLPNSGKPDPADVFKSLPDKFDQCEPDVCTQGGWIHTVIGYLEDELRTEFKRTDASRLHFAIFACWDEKAYVLARTEGIRHRINEVFDLPKDDTIILKEEPTSAWRATNLPRRQI